MVRGRRVTGASSPQGRHGGEAQGQIERNAEGQVSSVVNEGRRATSWLRVRNEERGLALRSVRSPRFFLVRGGDCRSYRSDFRATTDIRLSAAMKGCAALGVDSLLVTSNWRPVTACP